MSAAAAYWSSLLNQHKFTCTARYNESTDPGPKKERNSKPCAVVHPLIPPLSSFQRQTQIMNIKRKLQSPSSATVPLPAKPPAAKAISSMDMSAIKNNVLLDLIEERSPRSVLQITETAVSRSFSFEHSYIVGDGGWRSPRWKEIKQKRLVLGQKRVQLERRIMEACSFSPTKASSVSLSPAQHCELISGITVQWSGALDGISGLPTGYGRMVYRDGQIYEGVVVNGLRHGVGKNTWNRAGRHNNSANHSHATAVAATDQVYQGEWHLDHRHGRGTHTWPDGRSVTGQWQNGQLHGRVYFTWPDGSIYDGDVVMGRKHGQGMHTQRDGSVYTGDFVAGYQEGYGTLLTAHGQQYRGYFMRGQRHGFGVQIWITKAYEGEWVNNTMQGRGKLIWLDTGAVYEGDFHQGHLHGEGFYRNGKKLYVGQWRHGTREGRGAQRWADGPAYDGWFSQNKRHGFGRMIYSDDSIYVGGWENGQRSGFGIEISGSKGIRHCGVWECNVPKTLDLEARKSADDSNTMMCSTTPRITSLIRSRSLDECDLIWAHR